MSGLEVIPAGDSGQFRIRRYEMDTVTLAAFWALVEGEAERRGLEVQLCEDHPTGDYIVRWRPARHAGTETTPM